MGGASWPNAVLVEGQWYPGTVNRTGAGVSVGGVVAYCDGLQHLSVLPGASVRVTIRLKRNGKYSVNQLEWQDLGSTALTPGELNEFLNRVLEEEPNKRVILICQQPDAWLAALKHVATAKSSTASQAGTISLVLKIAASVRPSEIIFREQAVQFLSTLVESGSSTPFMCHLAMCLMSPAFSQSFGSATLHNACVVLLELAQFGSANSMSQVKIVSAAIKGAVQRDASLGAILERVDEAVRRAESGGSPSDQGEFSVRSAIRRAAHSATLPTLEELMEGAGALPVNLIVGPYRSVSDYLATHFHLIREDFVASIRDAIIALRSRQLDELRKVHVRKYEQVSFAGMRILPHGGGVVHRIKFGPRKDIDWDRTKWLIYGNLVTISFDNFKTGFFAKIANRELKLLADGFIDVQFSDACESSRFEKAALGSRVGVMLESPQLFIAVEPILQSLKSLDSHSEMPFSEDVVFLRQGRAAGQSVLPSYLNAASTLSLKISDRVVGPWPAAASEWPAEVSQLFSAQQYQAVRLAFRDRLAIIQGMPGSGKSTLARYIIELISSCSTKPAGPILLITYKNHALDQTLEKCLKFTDKVVRIGGGGKGESTALLGKNLNDLVLKYKDRRNPLQDWDLMRLRYEGRARRDEAETDLSAAVSALRQHRRRPFLERALDAVRKSAPADSRFALLGRYPELVDDKLAMRVIQLWQQGLSSADARLAVKVKEQRQQERAPTAVAAARRRPLQTLDDLELRARSPPSTPAAAGIGDVGGDSEDEFANEAMAAANEGFGSESDSDNVDSQAEHFSSSSSDEEEGNEHGEEDEVFTIAQGAGGKWKKQSKTHVGPATYASVPLEDPDFEGYTGNASYSSDSTSDDDSDDDVDDGVIQLGALWALSQERRNCMLRGWMDLCEDEMNRAELLAKSAYQQVCRDYKRLDHMLKLQVLRGADVVGATTTGCCIHAELLHHLAPAIVVCEEAAEVLEGQVIAALTTSVQHLILVGDDEQLQPAVERIELATKHRLSVSMFERLKRNEHGHVILTEQRRMRPEISALVEPIYPGLANHKHVLSYVPVSCVPVEKQIFFWSHSFPEARSAQGMSKQNVQEAKMVVAFANFLLSCDVPASSITILAPYTGQVRLLRGMCTSLKISTVDRYQGDENDVVLLSLTRSNERHEIGFLGRRNRANVALTRARKLLYIFGNAENLMSAPDKKSSEGTGRQFWQGTLDTLRAQCRVGDSITVCCPRHSSSTSPAKTPEDLVKLKHRPSLCKEPCGERLSCGHKCPLPCHASNMNHKTVANSCTVPVTKQFSGCEHVVNIACKVLAKSPQMLCPVEVDKALPCGHKTRASCSTPEHSISCNEPVVKTLTCGHDADTQCFKPAISIPCTKVVDKTLLCGHVAPVKCCVLVDKVHCSVPVANVPLPCGHVVASLPCHQRADAAAGKYQCLASTSFPCGHPARSPCWQVLAGRVRCKAEVDRALPCNHVARTECSGPNPPCSVLVEKPLPCGHKETAECCRKPEDVRCSVLRVMKTLPCGHQRELACATSVNAILCEVVVPDKRLPCSHDAIAKCGANPKKIACTVLCDRVLPCSHPCKCDKLCKDHVNTDCALCIEAQKVQRKLQRQRQKQARKEAQRMAKEQADQVHRKVGFSLQKITEAADANDWNKAKDFVERLTQSAHNKSFRVVSVHKVVNPELEMRFHARRAKLHDPAAVELKFHGTAPDNIERIAMQGFQLPPPSKRNMFGQGVYFATDASKSDQYVKNVVAGARRRMFLCQVAVGKMWVRRSAKPELTPDAVFKAGYDSVYAPRNSQVKFDEFIVYDAAQALPTYIVEYEAVQ